MTLRSKIFALAAALMLLAAAAWGVYAVEADREVRILCGLFAPGTSQAEMDRILSTAHFLSVEESSAGPVLTRTVSSRVNLRRNGCVVELTDGAVQRRRSWPD